MKIAPYSAIVKSIKSGTVSRSHVPPDPDNRAISEYQRGEMRKIEAEFGTTVDEIFSYYGKVDARKFFRVLDTICWWKSSNNQVLTETELIIVSLSGLKSEVNNGGFHQYFFNTSGDDWTLALKGMENAGDSDGVIRFRKALAIFPNGLPSRDRRTRWSQLDAIGEKAQFEAFESVEKDYFKSPYPDIQKVCEFLNTKRHDIKPCAWPNHRVE